MFLFFIFQETEGEIASILAQFKPLEQERNSLDQQQKQFLTEKNEVSRKINAFSEERNSIKVREELVLFEAIIWLYFIQRELEDAAEARVKAQQNVKHYEKRLQEAQQQVDRETQASDVLQEEFVVCLLPALFLWPNHPSNDLFFFLCT